MEIENLTLQSLLNDPPIRRKEVAAIWYFAQPDLNLIYGDIFRFLQGTPISMKSPVSYDIVPCLNFRDINEQIEHWKNKPSFESRIKQFFKKKK